jgi:hypothetical protein
MKNISVPGEIAVFNVAVMLTRALPCLFEKRNSDESLNPGIMQ